MFSFRKTLPTALCAAAFLFFAACSDGSDEPVFAVPVPAGSQALTVHAISSDFSAYTKQAVASLGGTSYNTASNATPDVIVLKGSEAASLNADQATLLVNAFLQGKTVIFDAPTVDNIIALGTNLETVLPEALKAKAKVGAYSIFNIVVQMTNLKAKIDASSASDASYLQRSFEAIALRKNQIYYVHDIDEAISESALGKSQQGGFVETNNSSKTLDKVKSAPATPLNSSTADYKRLTSDSISSFSGWVANKSVAATRSFNLSEFAGNGLISQSAINYTGPLGADPKDAQSFIHNFTASFNTSYRDHYDGRFEGRNENVEVRTDVWAFCQLDAGVDSEHRKDWYYVRTSLICHNEQLNVQNTWDDNKYVSPYFDYCYATVKLAGGESEAGLDLRAQDSSPQNAAGSTSFTTGMSVSIGGNVGFNMSGPTGGVSGGVTFSESTTRSIPDIGVNFTKDDTNKTYDWKYTTPTLTPGWSGFYTKCDDPKDIQKRMAIFDTYGVYTMKSDYGESAGTVELRTDASVRLTFITGWLSGFLDTTLNWYWYYSITNIHYYDSVKKPSNSKADYIMMFDAPTGSTAEKIDLWNNVLKEYISDWNSKETYYAVGNASLNTVAENYFASVKQKIQANKDVLKGRGFEGAFTFYIKPDSTSTKLGSFTETF